MSIRIIEDQLVLKVSESIDLSHFDIYKYDNFLDRLCGSRNYQKEAIRTACKYLLGGRYQSLSDLAEENYKKSNILQEKYANFSDMQKHLHLKDKLSCSIDLATGTGKSYVMYGIAQILLAEGVIDRVLVLCPSITIEKGLSDKFRDLSSNKDLVDLLPQDSNYKNPRIIQAVQTIENGDICIENIHSTYKNTKSAIGDSLLGSGSRVLVLNDEAHHIYSKPSAKEGGSRDLKKWFEFLSDQDFDFKYIVGVTGTPYTDNEYFADVVYRYSITQGIEEKFIKNVRYLKEIEGGENSDKRIQIIHQNHKSFGDKYHKVKPITIFISKDIEHCKKDHKEIIDLLKQREGLSSEEAEKKVLIVTSDKAHKENVELLEEVGQKNNPVEWICSVAMLSEGWDVPNVFQIVPSEQRAFNSKLLISQVIGRGLRVPQEYRGEEIYVTVMNHKRFTDKIDHLVDEVLEKEEKVISYPLSVPEKEGYLFSLYNLQYSEEQIEQTKDLAQPMTFDSLEKNGINLPASTGTEEVDVTYGEIASEQNTTISYDIDEEYITVDELTQKIYNVFQSWDLEQGTDYADTYDFDRIRAIIDKSLNQRGITKITKEIEGKCISAFGTMKRMGTKNVRYELKPKNIEEINILTMKPSTTNIANVKKGLSQVFYDEYTAELGTDNDKAIISELEEEVGKKSLIEVRNSTWFKTPLNLIITGSEPEKNFVSFLVDKENRDRVDAFIKSKDKNFYDFEYSYKHGEHTKRNNFNPDFFIKSGNKILVIEIKHNESEREYSRNFIQNKAKFLQAKQHFGKLNEMLSEQGIDQQYFFHFCTPKDFKTLFNYLRNDKIDKFQSSIETAFEDSEGFLMSDTSVKRIDKFDTTELKSYFGSIWDELEDNSRVFLATAEKNYQDNKNATQYNFPLGELAQTFELELRMKLFDRLRDQEDIALEAIEEEKNRDKNSNHKLVQYFEFASEQLDLGAMKTAIMFNKPIRNHIASLGITSYSKINRDFIDNNDYQNFEKTGLGKDFPNFIYLMSHFRNPTLHGSKTVTVEDYERIRGYLFVSQKILIKLLDGIIAYFS